MKFCGILEPENALAAVQQNGLALQDVTDSVCNEAIAVLLPCSKTAMRGDT